MIYHALEISAVCIMSRLWREGLGDVAEKEAMTQLLAALRKVMGYDERAQELAQSHGKSGLKHYTVTICVCG